MNVIAWVIIWLLAALVPFGAFAGGRNCDSSKIIAWVRAIGGILLGSVLIFDYTPDASMIWIVIIFVLIFAAAESLFREESDKVVFGIFLALAIIVVLAGIYTSEVSGVSNAEYFDSYITKKEGFPIRSEIPDTEIRFTTEELARSLAKQHMSEFGSNAIIVDMQITNYKGHKYWVALVSKMGSYSNYYKVSGEILIDFNNPDNPPIVLQETFDVADGLSFSPILGGAWGDAKARGYFDIDTAIGFSDVYPAFNLEDDKWYTAMTTYKPTMRGVHEFGGLYLLTPGGRFEEKYTKKIPSWLIQPYPETEFLEEGIKDWGEYRDGDSFSYWAESSIFSPASSDRVQMSEDSRYILNPDTNRIEIMTMVHPVRDRGELTLAGVFMTTSDEITYYDLSKYNLMSGVAAGNAVQSKLQNPNTGKYFTAMELLYPINISDNETKHAYFVPIYFSGNDGYIKLEGLGIVDAQNANNVVVEYAGNGLTGTELVRKTKESFRALFRKGGSAIQSSQEEINRNQGINEPFVIVIRSNGNETRVALPLNATITIVAGEGTKVAS